MMDTDRLLKPLRSTLRAVGSLQYAGLLLVLLLVGLACAVLYESTHGTEQALANFYRAWWLTLLGVLLATNLLAAVAARYPFSLKHVGFVLAHLSVVVILIGADVSRRWSINGQVRVLEGQTVQDFSIDQESLTLVRRSDRARVSVDLPQSVLAGFRSIEHPQISPLSLDKLHIEIGRYLPDSVEIQRVVNDNPYERAAIEISLTGSDQEATKWVFAGPSIHVGSTAATFRMVKDREVLHRILAETTNMPSASKGIVKIDFEGDTFEYPLEACLDKAVQVADTGRTIRILRYLPHAVVGENNKLRSASDEPMNPAIEVEIDGPTGKKTQLAFAKFPEFRMLHGVKNDSELKITFISAVSDAAAVPIEVLGSADGELCARFSSKGSNVVIRKLIVGTPVETPWQGQILTVLRLFDHAREERVVEPIEPGRQDRRPAVQLKINTGTEFTTLWLQKYVLFPLIAEGETYEIIYSNKTIPLGFGLTLNDFKVGYYPGTHRPRSFESHVTAFDPTSGREQGQVISMNHPAIFGGYILYQSSYDRQGGKDASVLSVSWDPGQPIVFVGYTGTLIGMLWLVITRMRR